jgi:hypothetical protein
VANDADYRSLPFQEAIDFLRQKVNVPSAKWADILEGAHARAFTVAGATKDGMLVDFRAAIDKALAQGTTLEEFRKDFDQIVARYGWDYNGTRGWRTRVIYSTNLTTAYAAGRYQQMTDPDVLRYQPYWRYRHADGVLHPRPQHLAWDGTVLDADDAWWKTHYPPNGWGCHCYVEPLSRRELADSGKRGPDQAPPVEMERKTLSTSAGPLTIDVPKGIDPGWGYNVGDAAFGRQLPEHVMEAWRQQRAQAWERLTPGDWQSAARPRELPIDTAKAPIGATARDTAGLEAAIARALGAPQKALDLPDGSTVLVDAAALAAHVPLNRSAFVTLLPELAAEPYEIWLSFERHRGTGLVVLRKRIIKLVRTGQREGLILVAQASAGMLEAWTFVPTDDLAYLQRQRVGRLLWARQ